MTPGDHPACVVNWNKTQYAFSKESSVVDLLNAAAARYAGHPAVRVTGGVALTHAELAAESTALAGRLTACGVRAGMPVAVLVDHVPEAVVAIHAVLRTGAYYVPLDRRWPRQRMAAVLDSIKADYVLATEAYLDQVSELVDRITIIPVSLISGTGSAGSLEVLLTAPRPADLAYAIFTSGSTGEPKAVAVRHTSVVNLIEWFNRRHGIGPGDVMLQVAAFSFDLSVYDIFGVLAAGGSVLLLPDTELEEPKDVATTLLNCGVTLWNSAPAMFTGIAMFLDGMPGGDRKVLRRVFLSGDWIPLGTPEVVRREFPNATLVALGGATEACVWSNDYIVVESDPSWRSIPYGTPMQNCRYYVLREDRTPCATEETGELHISGICVAVGYLNDVATSTERFTTDPWDQGDGWTMYRTGDRARWTSGGWVEFLGRLDSQVKVHGFRFELSVIDYIAAKIPGVEEAVTLTAGNARDPFLALALRTSIDLAPTEIRDRLREWLPDYMIPQRVLTLPSFPVGNTGKTDRAVLRSLFAEGTGASLHA
jgi:amino acid adenylation domain-containing protein